MDQSIRERSQDDLADKQAQRAGNCQCFGDMPGTCPGPHNCPMCETAAVEGAEFKLRQLVRSGQ